MDLAQMNIVIGANVAQAEQGLNNVSKSLANTAVAAQKVDSSIGKMGAGSTTAAFALQNLGRVAQDAPFGFIAIQNNLNPLLESFQRLKAESGSSAAALKALGSSMLGPAGVGIALSLISSAIVLYSQHAQQAKKATDDFTDALATTAANLNTELTKLSSLVQVARDVSETSQARTAAIKELQKEYPGYLQNINLENINSQEAANAIEKLTGALERKAKVQAYSNLLTKAEEELIKEQNKNISDEVSSLDVVLSSIKNLGSFTGTAGDLVKKGTKAQAEAVKELQAVVDKYSHTLSDLTRTQAENNDFTLLNPTKIKAAAKAINDFLLVDTNIKDIPARFINAIAIETGDALATVQRTLDKSPLKFNFPAFEIPEKFKEISAVTDLVKSSFDDLFSSIASGASVFEAIGNELKKLITRIAAAVVEAAILRVILTAFFPAQAGLSQFAFGSLFSSLSGLPKFATGGVVTRPTLALVGESGPERISPLSQMSNGGEIRVIVEGQISNDHIYIANKRASATRGFTH